MSIAQDTRPTKTFDTLPTIDGYQVVFSDTGRPIAARATHASANGLAFVLNQAAKDGPKALARALGAGKRS